METPIHTSQQKRGEHHAPEGDYQGPTKGSFPFGSEDQPTGVPVQRSGNDQLKTSQQLRGEHKKLDSAGSQETSSDGDVA